MNKQTNQTQGSNRKALYIIIAVLLLGLLSGGTYMYFDGPHQEKSKNSSIVAQEAPKKEAPYGMRQPEPARSQVGALSGKQEPQALETHTIEGTSEMTSSTALDMPPYLREFVFTETQADPPVNQAGNPMIQKYGRYTNERFGFAAVIPEDAEVELRSANGDGETFRWNEMFITISGINNVLNQTLDGAYGEAVAHIPSDAEDIYKAKAENWYVVSFREGGSSIISYTKVFIGANQLNTLQLRYPKEPEDVMNPVVRKIIEHFTASPNL